MVVKACIFWMRPVAAPKCRNRCFETRDERDDVLIVEERATLLRLSNRTHEGARGVNWTTSLGVSGEMGNGCIGCQKDKASTG